MSSYRQTVPSGCSSGLRAENIGSNLKILALLLESDREQEEENENRKT